MKDKIIRPAHDILHISPTADNRTARKAYKRMVRQFPPESHPEKFTELNEAYQEITADSSVFEKYTQENKAIVTRYPLQRFLEMFPEDSGEERDLKALSEVPESIFNADFLLEKLIK